MNGFENISRIYFLGIGGIGMSALARYFLNKKMEIYGYDLTSTPLTRALETEGMKIHYKESPDSLPDNIDLIIYTPAIPTENIEFLFLKTSGIRMIKRAEVIGVLSRKMFTIAIAGTHGKTSITALTAHLLINAGIPVTAFIGGICKNFNSNFITSEKAKVLLVEADEFDRSLLQLQSDIALVSSVEADHLDIYKNLDDIRKTFAAFAGKIKPHGKLIIRYGLDVFDKFKGNKLTYGIIDKADLFADNISFEKEKFRFQMHFPENKTTDVLLKIPGQHSTENALGAAAIAREMNISTNQIIQGLESFDGVERRFDYRIDTPALVYIDDYAHHPGEIKVTLETVKKLYPNQKITVVFQPHLFSRTRDFSNSFAKTLSIADEIFLLPIYPAREKPIAGISSNSIFNKIKKKKKKLLDKKQLLKEIENRKPEVLLSLGAGDIGLLVPEIEKILKS